jgi:hypothetical protein
MAIAVGLVVYLELHHIIMWLSSTSSSSSSSSAPSIQLPCTPIKGVKEEPATTGGISPFSQLWHDMSPSRQEDALEGVMQYLKAHAHSIQNQGYMKSYRDCNFTQFGRGQGAKLLCDFPSTTAATSSSSCKFISFGINDEYSFDADLALRKNCKGFAADPTVVHPSQLQTPLVTFHNIGAKLLRGNEEQMHANTDWWSTSIPSLRKFLNISNINVLKMDCEGCEYSLARDIVLEEGASSDFFHHVDQFSFEVHLTKLWMPDTESLYYLGLLFKLMDDAGLKSYQATLGSCSGRHERYGCLPQLKEIGYPSCPNSCHDYLFVKESLFELSLEEKDT